MIISCLTIIVLGALGLVDAIHISIDKLFGTEQAPNDNSNIHYTTNYTTDYTTNYTRHYTSQCKRARKSNE